MEKEQTLRYYEENAEAFAESTLHVDFTETQNRFLEEIREGGRILDFGCGSGRDTKYFLDRGYEVDAVDGSEELCRLASDYTGIEVKRMYFQELAAEEAYDGVWACASILHLPKGELADVFWRIRIALKKGGVLYTSFKYGTFEGLRNGRYFTCFTEESFAEFLGERPEKMVTWITGDVRAGRDSEKWLNVLLWK